MESAQALLQHAPPADLEKNVNGMEALLFNSPPEVIDALHKKYCLPFQVMEVSAEDAKVGDRPFLMCAYNQVGGGGGDPSSKKYRSPWTNQIYPKTSDAAASPATPDDDPFRFFESKMNDVWSAYANLYYGHSVVSSVYLTDKENGAIGGVFGIQKLASESGGDGWNSVHVIDVSEPTSATSCVYKVESTVLLTLSSQPSSTDSSAANFEISAVVSKEVVKEAKISQAVLAASHIENLGKIMEANEIDLRSVLERVHIPKLQEAVHDIQKDEPKRPAAQVNPLMSMVMGSPLLLKKQQQEESGTSTFGMPAKRPGPPPGGINPLMMGGPGGGVMASPMFLKKQREKQAAEAAAAAGGEAAPAPKPKPFRPPPGAVNPMMMGGGAGGMMASPMFLKKQKEKQEAEARAAAAAAAPIAAPAPATDATPIGTSTRTEEVISIKPEPIKFEYEEPTPVPYLSATQKAAGLPPGPVGGSGPPNPFAGAAASPLFLKKQKEQQEKEEAS